VGVRRGTNGHADHANKGAIAIAYGPSPTLIGGPGVLVAVAIGVTVSPRPLDTYTGLSHDVNY
jgi:hypothetical protein